MLNFTQKLSKCISLINYQSAFSAFHSSSFSFRSTLSLVLGTRQHHTHTVSSNTPHTIRDKNKIQIKTSLDGLKTLYRPLVVLIHYLKYYLVMVLFIYIIIYYFCGVITATMNTILYLEKCEHVNELEQQQIYIFFSLDISSVRFK